MTGMQCSIIWTAAQHKSISFLWPDAAINQSGLFGEAETRIADKQRLKYGLRLDYVQASADKVDDKPEAGPKTANQMYQMYYGVKASDKTETNVGGLLRYELDFNKDMVFFSGLSRSVRTADATERYMNKFAMMPVLQWVGNPDIKPEKHHQIDLGIGQHNERVNWNGVLFYDDVSDYILRDTARGQSGVLLVKRCRHLPQRGCCLMGCRSRCYLGSDKVIWICPVHWHTSMQRIRRMLIVQLPRHHLSMEGRP